MERHVGLTGIVGLKGEWVKMVKGYRQYQDDESLASSLLLLSTLPDPFHLDALLTSVGKTSVGKKRVVEVSWLVQMSSGRLRQPLLQSTSQVNQTLSKSAR